MAPTDPQPNQIPLSLGQPGLQPSRHLTLVEICHPRQFEPEPLYFPWAGSWFAQPGRGRLFAYNGGVVRAYLDGHASGGNPEELGWVSTGPKSGEWLPGYTSFTTESAHKAPWFGTYNGTYNRLY